MFGFSVRAVFLAVGVLVAGSATAGEPDDFRLRYFGADIEREGGRRDGPVVKVQFRSGSKLTGQAIAALKDFTGIRSLNLSSSPIRSGLFDAIRGMKDLEVLHMPSGLVDNELAVVAGMPRLRELRVVAVGYGPGVTDDGVKALRDLKEMRKLKLWSNKLTDTGLKHIAGLTKLTELELVDTKISDASMPLLATFTDLERLDLTFTKVTPDGLRQLKSLKKLKELRPGAGSKEEIAATFTELGLKHLLPKEPDGKQPPQSTMGVELDDIAVLQANWSGIEVSRNFLSIDGSSPGKLVGGYFGDREMEIVARVRGMKSFALSRAPNVTEKGISRLKECKELSDIRLDGRPLNKSILTELAALPALKVLEGVSVDAADIPLLKSFKALEELRLSDNSKLTDESLADYEKAGKIDCLIVRVDFEEQSRLNYLRPLPVAPGISFQRTKVTDKGIAMLARHPKIEWVRLAAAQMTDAGAKHIATLPALTHVIAPKAQISEKQAAHLAEIKYLESVVCNSTPGGVRGLAACPQLRILELHGATDDCLHEVSKLSKLAVLRINGSQLSDAGIKHLKSMKGLLFLQIANADRVTGAAVREVRDALRGCEVRRY
jgi:Leucine-rich repeat (LRR) protein